MSNQKETAPEPETDGALRENEKDGIYELKEEIHRLSEELGIPVEEATKMVYEDRGIQLPERTRVIDSIKELAPGMRNISIKARVISVQKMERPTGEPYFRGFLGDVDSEIRYTCWMDFPFPPNTPLFLQNISVREWNGKTEVVINDRSFISQIEDMEGLLPNIEDTVPSTISYLSRDSKGVDI